MSVENPCGAVGLPPHQQASSSQNATVVLSLMMNNQSTNNSSYTNNKSIFSRFGINLISHLKDFFLLFIILNRTEENLYKTIQNLYINSCLIILQNPWQTTPNHQLQLYTMSAKINDVSSTKCQCQNILFPGNHTTILYCENSNRMDYLF